MQTRPASVPPMVQGVVSTPTSEISPGTAAAFGTLVAMWVHLTAARARGFPLDACRPLVIPLSLLLLLPLLLLLLLFWLVLLLVVVLLLLWLAASTFVILMDDTDALRCFLSLFFCIFIFKKKGKISLEPRDELVSATGRLRQFDSKESDLFNTRADSAGKHARSNGVGQAGSAYNNPQDTGSRLFCVDAGAGVDRQSPSRVSRPHTASSPTHSSQIIFG